MPDGGHGNAAERELPSPLRRSSARIPCWRRPVFQAALGSTIFGGERIVRHGEVNDRFDKSDQSRNKGPEEDEVDNPHPDLAQIEFVNAQAADQQRENGGHDAVLAAWRGSAQCIGGGDTLSPAAMRASDGGW